MKLFAVDLLQKDSRVVRNSMLRKNKIDLYDSLYDPFGDTTDAIEVLDISQSVDFYLLKVEKAELIH